MAEAWNACIAYNNLADTATLSVTSALADSPITLLQNPHVLRRWLVASGSSPTITADLGSDKSMDTFMLGAPGGACATSRIKVFTAAQGTGGTAAYDSTALTNQYDPNYLPLVHLKSTPVVGRYVQWPLTDCTGAGRLFIGPRKQFTYNFAPGWSRTPITNSKRRKGIGGQTFVDLKQGTWAVDVTFEWISEADRNDFVEAMDVLRVNSGHVDMLWIKDPTSSNLSRDCQWGFEDQDQAVTEPFITSPSLYRRTYRIEARL